MQLISRLDEIDGVWREGNWFSLYLLWLLSSQIYQYLLLKYLARMLHLDPRRVVSTLSYTRKYVSNIAHTINIVYCNFIYTQQKQ